MDPGLWGAQFAIRAGHIPVRDLRLHRISNWGAGEREGRKDHSVKGLEKSDRAL